MSKWTETTPESLPDGSTVVLVRIPPWRPGEELAMDPVYPRGVVFMAGVIYEDDGFGAARPKHWVRLVLATKYGAFSSWGYALVEATVDPDEEAAGMGIPFDLGTSWCKMPGDPMPWFRASDDSEGR